jgi:hypothetical protein
MTMIYPKQLNFDSTYITDFCEEHSTQEQNHQTVTHIRSSLPSLFCHRRRCWSIDPEPLKTRFSSHMHQELISAVP